MSLQQRLHIREQRLLLVFHVQANLASILVVEAENETCQGKATGRRRHVGNVVLVERLRQLPADVGQLKVEEIGMARFEIVEQGWDADLFIGIELSIPVSSIINHSQERIGVDIVILTGLLYGLVAKTQADAETA